MGKKICHSDKPDRELDPKVIARRTLLFNKYVLPFKNMIYFLCIKYSFDSKHIEENYTEVLINFYRRVETYDPERPIRTWLHIVTKRHIWSLEQKRLQEANKSFDVDVEDIESELLDEDRVSGNVMGVDNYQDYYNDDILYLLDQLKPCYKDALMLQEAGYSLKEIAEIEYQKGTLKSKNIETVKSRLRIARQYLKAHLTRDGERISFETDNKNNNRDNS